MKISFCLTILLSAMLVAAQEKDCSEECVDVRDHCTRYHMGGCQTDYATCSGKCRAKACIKGGRDSFNYGEKCGCHSDCSNSNCEGGVCCKGSNVPTNDVNQCCSKSFAHREDKRTSAYYECA